MKKSHIWIVVITIIILGGIAIYMSGDHRTSKQKSQDSFDSYMDRSTLTQEQIDSVTATFAPK